MIDSIITFSIRNKLIIGLLTISLVIWGIYSLVRLPIDAVPDITNNQVQVLTTAPTLAAEEVERYITYPLEIAMSTIPDLVEIRSISRLGFSVLTIVFKDEVDILDARQLVGERLRVAQSQIPSGYGNPELAPISTGLSEIYQYILEVDPKYRDKYSAMELRTIQDWNVRRQILGTQGIADISSFGGYLKQYEVEVDPAKLKGMGVNMYELLDVLQKNNQNTGGAYIDKKPNAYFIRSIGIISDTTDIGNIVIKNIDGIPLLINDVANVKLGSAIRYGAMTKNNEGEAVGGIVLMLKGENSNQVIENVKTRIASIQKSLPPGILIKPFIDRSALVKRAIHTVSKNLIEGGLIVIFVLVFLLGNFRAGIVVASVIPLSMLFAISMMQIFGVSGNLMSLGAIDFGLIVDGAVIIVEAIVYEITQSARKLNIPKLNQSQMDDQVIETTVKIRKTAAFGEIIILMVYLPILALTGIEGKMFKPMAQTVSFAIFGAFIFSLTYVPMMSSLILSKRTTLKKSISEKLIDKLHQLYKPVLLYALRHRIMVLSISILILLSSFYLFTKLGGEFLPTLEEGDFAVETRLVPGSSLSQTIQTAQNASGILKQKFPEVKEVIGKIGTSEIPTDPMPIESCDLIVVLKDKDEWTSADDRVELANKMNQQLSVIPGVEFSFQQPIQMRFNELMTGVRQDIAIKIFGEDLDVLAKIANKASLLIKNKEGVGDLFVEKVTGLPQIIIHLKRNKIAKYGLSINEVNGIIRTAYAGEIAGVVFDGQKRFDLVVRVSNQYRNNIDNIKSLYIPLPSGVQIPITEIADVEFKRGPIQISREDTKRRITIGINVRNRDVQSLVEEIQQTLNQQLNLKPGYTITYGGQFENLIEAKKRLIIAVPAALSLIFILLYFTFGSVKQTLLIFTAVPFASIGGIVALTLRSMPFSISAGVGFIALFGVAVLNGIVLIGYFNQLKIDGANNVVKRILKGTKVRLRPVIMTATVASLGFLPMAISGTAGAEVQRPLATVVIGGLITSTVLTLIVLPVLYSYFEAGKKLNAGGGSAALLVLFLVVPFLCKGQDMAYKVNVNEAVNVAISNNPSIQSARSEIERQKVLKGTAVDLGKANLTMLYGQYNTFAKDNSFNLNQNFSFPSFYINNSRFLKHQIDQSENKKSIAENELKKNVRLAFYQYLISQEKLKIYQYQDSVYREFSRLAQLRFKTEESNYLEKLAAEARMLEVQNTMYQAQADVLIYKSQLQKLMNIQTNLAIEYDSAYYVNEYIIDTSRLNGNPYLVYSRNEILTNRIQTQIFKSNLLPDFNVGYTSQTLIGFYRKGNAEVYYGPSNRFQYLHAGLFIPIWVKPYKSRMHASQINEQIASSNHNYLKLQFETELQKLILELYKYTISINYYRTKGLALSNTLAEFAHKAYKEGESGYFEYILNLTEAIQIKINYLNAVHQINQVNIHLDYILGGK